MKNSMGQPLLKKTQAVQNREKSANTQYSKHIISSFNLLKIVLYILRGSCYYYYRTCKTIYNDYTDRKYNNLAKTIAIMKGL